MPTPDAPLLTLRQWQAAQPADAPKRYSYHHLRQLAYAGRWPAARKVGRDWLVPADAPPPITGTPGHPKRHPEGE